MKRAWKLGMDSLLFLFYINIAILLYASVSSAFYPVSLSGLDQDLFETKNEHIDPSLKRYARLYGLDWRFVYAIIYVESRFKPDAVSYAGALGLMQVLPKVAIEYDVEDLIHPDQNIKTGIRHFHRYYNSLKGNTHQDRINMALAAYNGGIGHIYDAKLLAQRKGLDPYHWKDVARVLPELEKEEVYSQYRHGYCQGRRIVRYVTQIQKAYQHYKTIYPFHPMIPEPNQSGPMTALPFSAPTKS